MRGLKSELLTFAITLHQMDWCIFTTITPTYTRGLSNIFEIKDPITYCCFSCSNQHHAWHAIGITLLRRDASCFLLFHSTLDTTLDKMLEADRWRAHPKWGYHERVRCASHSACKMSQKEITKKMNQQTKCWTLFLSILSNFVQGALKHRVKIKNIN